MSDIVIPSIENIDLLRTLKDVKELTIKIHETLVTTKKALDKKIEELNECAQAKEMTDRKNEILREENFKMNEKVSELSNENKELTVQSKEAKAMISQVEEKLSDYLQIKSRLEELSQENACNKRTTNQEEEIERLKSAIEEKENIIQCNEIEYSNINNQLEEKNNKIEELELKLSKIELRVNQTSTNEQIKKTLQDYKALIEEHKECKNKIKNLESRLINEKEVKIIYNQENNNNNKNNNKNNTKTNITNDEIEIIDKNENLNGNLKLNLKITEFHGREDEVIKDWLYNTENVFQLSNIKEENRVAYAKTFLRKAALTNFKAFETSKNNNVTWSEFKQHLLNKYRPLYHEETIREKLKELKMEKTETIRTFVNRFQTLIAEIDKMEEKDKIFYFVSALLDKTKKWVQVLSPQSLEQAIEIAEKYETFNFIDKQEQNKNIMCATKTYPSNYKKKIFSAPIIGHRTNKYAKNKRFQRTHKYRPKFVSYNTNNNKTQSNDNKETNENKENVKCYKCGENGHYKSECHKNKNNSSSKRRIFSMHINNSNLKLLRYWAHINNEKVGVVFDCAAEQSLISKECAEKLNLKIEDSKIQIDDSNGGTSTIIGMVENQTINLESTEATLNFCVTNIKNVDVLLGLDWFAQTKVILNPANRHIIIPAKTIHCKNKEYTSETDEEESEDENEISNEVFLSAVINEEDFEDAPQYKQKQSIENIKINEKISSQYKNKLQNIINNYKNRFSNEIKDLGCIPNTEFVIETITEIPTIKNAYQIPIQNNKKFKEIVKEMLDANIIRRGKAGTWSSPSFVLNQKGGERFIVDFRDVNAKTKKFNHPLPRIEALFNKMQGSKIKTKLDAKKGYFQCKIAENSKHKTGFITPFGIYEFNRLPFGLCNAPAYFTQIMQNILGDLEFIANFVDDIIVFSNNEEEHLKHLEIVFKRLEDNNITLNPEKCEFFQDEIKVLGHKINQFGIEPDPDQIKAISERKEPTNLKELQSFLGLTNVFRKFIKNYADIAAPLHALTNKDTVYNWSHLCQKAFDTLKEKLTTYPILRLPDPNKSFILKTDASLIAKGAVLCQLDEEGREYVIAYASQLNKKGETKYSISELECLAIVWAINLFRNYLYGRKFTIITDHLALKWLLTLKNPNARLTRWSVLLQTFDFEIVHREGKKLSDADALSRPVLATSINDIDDQEQDENPDEKIKELDPWEDTTLIHFLTFGRHKPGIAKKQCKRVSRLARYYKMENGKLWYRKPGTASFDKEIPKIEQRQDIIKNEHNIGHFKTKTTSDRILEKYYWKNMNFQIKKHIEKCKECLMFDRMGNINELAKALKVTGIFDNIHIDCVFGFEETKEKYIGYLSITCNCSKWIEIYALKSKNSEEIAQNLMKWISTYGPPKNITSDQGKEFLNEIIDKLCKNNNINKHFTSAYNPRANGQAERTNQTFTKIIQKYAHENKSSWNDFIPFALLAYRTKKHTASKFSPYELVFGRKMNEFLDWSQTPSEDEEISLLKRAIEIKIMIEDTHPKAIENIQNSQEIQKRTQNKQLNGKVENEIPIGTKVLIKDCRLIKSKLDPLFNGEFNVSGKTSFGNYILTNKENKEIEETFPRWKLKTIKNSNEQPNECDLDTIKEQETITKDKIIAIEDFQKIGKGARYLVRLKNNNLKWYPRTMMNKNLLDDYHEKIKKPLKKKTTIFTKSNFLTKLITIIFFSFMIATTDCTKLNDNFKVCPTKNLKEFINTDTYCKENFQQVNNNQMSKFDFITDKNDIKILSLSKYIIDDYGYQCYKYRKIKEMNETWYLSKTESLKIDIIHLSRLECLAMIESKRCNNKEMTCDNDNCIHQGKFNLNDYEWNQLKSDETYDCHFKKIKILTDNPNKQLFKAITGDCVASSLSCQLYDSIVVWNNSIIDYCGLNIIHTGFNYSTRDNLIYSKKENYLFEISNFTIKCNIRIFPTTDNLFVSFIKDPFNLISLQKLNDKPRKIIQKDINNLMLAEIDFDRLELWDEIIKTNKAEQIAACSIFLNQLKLFAKENDKLTKIRDLTGEEIVIYSFNKMIFKSQCITVNEIDIIDTKLCYDDIEVEFKNNNKTYKGYLTDENIIKLSSKVTTCENHRKIFKLPTKNQIIIQDGNKIKINKLETLIEIRIDNFMHNQNQPEFNHNKEIIDGFDFEKYLDIKNDENNDIDGGYYILPDDKITTSNDIIKDLQIAKEFVSKELLTIKNNFLFGVKLIKISVIIGILGILGILLTIIINNIAKNKKLQKQKDKQEIIELKERFNKANSALGQC